MIPPPAFPQTPCGQNSESRQKTLAEEKRNPYPQNFCFHFPSPFWITTLVERGSDIKIKKKAEREINFNHLDLAQNSFELCPRYTAKSYLTTLLNRISSI